MTQNSEIQLLPERRKEIEVKIPGENRSLFLGFAIAGIVLISFVAVSIYSSSIRGDIDSLASEIKSLNAQRNKDAESQILSIQNHFAIVSKILNKHLIWSYILGKIQSKTSPQFQFNTISISIDDQKVNVEGEIASYTVLARQIASYLSDEVIKDVMLDEARLLPTGRVRVSMRILFNENDIQLGAINP